jgi:diacylglycerol kinase
MNNKLKYSFSCNTVDLVTKEFYTLVKSVKDIGAITVIIALVMYITTCIGILF